jgi:hypothetical protein
MNGSDRLSEVAYARSACPSSRRMFHLPEEFTWMTFPDNVDQELLVSLQDLNSIQAAEDVHEDEKDARVTQQNGPKTAPHWPDPLQ